MVDPIPTIARLWQKNCIFKKLCNYVANNWGNNLNFQLIGIKTYKYILLQFFVIGIKTIKQIYWNFRNLNKNYKYILLQSFVI